MTDNVTTETGHPKGLWILFLSEMWERFSYYGMRALLILYMTKELFSHLSQGDADSVALGIYGSYTAMVYLFPVVGGILADKILGFRKAILFGGLLMMAGHFALSFQGMYFEDNMSLFFLSLAFIIIGNGFFKPNISSLLGKYYGTNDSRKDGAFTIFYMGVNIGALLSTVTCGYVGEQISWHYGFGLAGIGMLIGLLVFWLAGDKILGKKGINPSAHENFPDVDEAAEMKLLGATSEERASALIFESSNFEQYMTPTLRRNQILTFIGTILFIPICALFLNLSSILTTILLVMSVGILGVLFFMSTKEERIGGQRLWVVIILFLFHTIFWALFEQAGGSLTLFTERNVDRMVGSSEIPASIIAKFCCEFSTCC